MKPNEKQESFREFSLITSLQNTRIKEVVQLREKSKLRREKSLFIVEGSRELSHCLESGYRAEAIFYAPEILPSEDLRKLEYFAEGAGIPFVYPVSRTVYEKIACRESTEGILAVVRERKRTLEEIRLSPVPLILVLERVEKPGNLGALLRTADACGADAVLICDPLTDLYNPNLIRASLGGIFTLQVVSCSGEEACRWLKKHRISIFTAQLQDSEWYYDTDMTGPCAIVMGTESTGLTEFWRKESDARIRIPMLGKLDSLNVSVSAAVLCYEAVRQRNRQ